MTKQKLLLSFTLLQLENAYVKLCPQLKQMAEEATDFAGFKNAFSCWVDTMPDSGTKELFRNLLENKGKTIHEWSRHEDMTLSTIELLYKFLCHETDPSIGTDLFIDLYMQFKRLLGHELQHPSEKKIRQLTQRWSTHLAVRP